MPALAEAATREGDNACPDRACPMLLTIAGHSQEHLAAWCAGGPGYPPEARCKGRFCMYEGRDSNAERGREEDVSD